MSKVIRALTFLVGLVLGVSTTPSVAYADEGLCGTSCIACEGAPSPDYKTGSGHLGHATYKLFCTQGNCSSCGNAEQFATRAGERRNALASRLRVSLPSEFARLALQHRSALRIDGSRRLLVVLGGCDGNAVVSVVSLNARQLAALEGIGVASLASHYESRRSRVPTVVASAN